MKDLRTTRRLGGLSDLKSQLIHAAHVWQCGVAMEITFHPAVEARGWLRNNPNRSAFATNRFGETANALAFVESLYAKGATEVLVDNPGVDSAGSPRADTLLVRFPERGDARWDLERFCEQEGPGDVPPGDFTMHQGQAEFRLWWD